jgi:hypothetical protein
LTTRSVAGAAVAGYNNGASALVSSIETLVVLCRNERNECSSERQHRQPVTDHFGDESMSRLHHCREIRLESERGSGPQFGSLPSAWTLAALYSIAYKRGMPDHRPAPDPCGATVGLWRWEVKKHLYLFYSLFHTCDESIDELFFDV